MNSNLATTLNNNNGSTSNTLSNIEAKRSGLTKPLSPKVGSQKANFKAHHGPRQRSAQSTRRGGKKKNVDSPTGETVSISPATAAKPLKPTLSYASDLDELYMHKGASGRKGRNNLTHLLQFTLPPRQTTNLRPGRRYNSLAANRSTPFNKYRYMNANFRFLVRASQDYKLQLINPDDYVEWVDVQQVIVNTSEELTCPICLSTPIAPRMTACGHLYCHSCILRYLNEQPTDVARSWRKCPICYDPIYTRALKPVLHLIATSQPKVPSTVSFRLMQRYPGSTIALPCSEHPEQTSEASLPWDSTPGALIYSRITLCSATHLCAHLKSEKNALLLELNEAKAQGEPSVVQYIQLALSETISKISELSSELNSSSLVNLSATLSPPSESPNFFYQSADGQYVFLQPLHARILAQYYATLPTGLPLSLELPITHYEESTIDEELRKQFKFLAYLPLGCDVAFVDIDLEQIVVPETLEQFKTPLEARSRHLKAKKKAEQRKEIQATSNYYSSLEPMGYDNSVYDISSDPNAFPDIVSRPEHSDSASNLSDPLTSYGVSPGSSGNWASMATRTRDSTANWSVASRDNHEYAPRPQRTLGEDIDRAMAESILSMSSLELDASSSKKNGKKGNKKKLVLVSSNVQRRR